MKIEPGIYTNVPAEEYFGWEAMNRSTLEHAGRSMLHLHAAMTTPAESSDAMDLGTALHCAVLEPDAFSRRYVVAPKVDRADRTVGDGPHARGDVEVTRRAA